MADNISFSYSHQADISPPSAVQPRSGDDGSGSGPLYAYIDIVPVNLGSERVLLLHKRSGSQLVVARRVATVLPSCVIFQTLGQHVEMLTSTYPELQGKQADIRRVLEMIRDAGLLTTAATVCEHLNTQQTEGITDLAPTRVFVITCDRPAAVQRLLQSMQLAGNLGRHQELFLVDDSRDPQNVALNRELVENFNLTSPRDMRYVGSVQQEKMLQVLVGQLPEHEQGIRFLIDRKRWCEHKSYGLARTLCLLLSVDCRAIVIDDDVICAAVSSPYREAGLGFGDGSREVEFYSSEQDLLARTQKADFEPLGAQASCLGMTMGEAIHAFAPEGFKEADLRGENAAFLSQWRAQSPILITQCGSVGDPGIPGAEWVYTLPKPSAERLLASEGGLSGALRNRYYWMGHARPTFSKMGVISQMTGLDNARFLPPYFPVYRGEDYLFGAMVEYLYPEGVVLNYNWAVPHFPLEARDQQHDKPPPSGKGAVNLAKLITDRTQYDTGLSIETRMEKLALLLREFSEISDRGLLTLYRAEVAESQGIVEALLAAKLEDGTPRSEEWQAYLRQTQANLGRAMHDVASPEDTPNLPAGYDEQAVLSEFRAHASEFALALKAWPAVRDAAREITGDMLQAGEFAP